MSIQEPIDKIIEEYSYFNKVIGNFLIEYKECQGKFPETNKEDALVFLKMAFLLFDIHSLIRPLLKDFIIKNGKDINCEDEINGEGKV